MSKKIASSSKSATVPLGVRLAMRVEGKVWNAYLADRDSMQGALLIASIQMDFARDNEMRDAFINFSKFCVDRILSKTINQADLSWGGITRAPEHERGGSA